VITAHAESWVSLTTPPVDGPPKKTRGDLMKFADAFEAELTALCGPAAAEDGLVVEDLDGFGDNVALLTFCLSQPAEPAPRTAIGAVAA
jgi:hypothetical protein